MCARLAAEGWNVAVHYNRSHEEAESLVAELSRHGVKSQAFRADLASLQETSAMFAEVVAAFGSVHALINNASHFEYDRGQDPDWALWDRQMAINLRAGVQLASLLHAQATESNRCCVINVLDQKLYNLNPDHFSYTISKMGLEGATRVLAMEYAPLTRVCAIAPGITLQSPHQSADNFERGHKVAALGKSSTTDDLAGAVSYLLNAPAVTGTTLVVDGGQHLIPLSRDVSFAVDFP